MRPTMILTIFGDEAVADDWERRPRMVEKETLSNAPRLERTDQVDDFDRMIRDDNGTRSMDTGTQQDVRANKSQRLTSSSIYDLELAI